MQNELLKLINECHKQNSNCKIALLGSQTVINKVTGELPEYCKTIICVSDLMLEEDKLYVFQLENWYNYSLP